MAMRIVPIALGFAAVACRPQPSTTIAPARPPTPIPAEPIASPPLAAGTQLVVRPGATVWLDGSDARPLQLPAALTGGGLRVRVLGNVGERVEVEIDTDAPCTSSPLRDLRLRLFALRSDLGDPPAQCGEVPNDRQPPASVQHTTRIIRGGAQVFWRDGEPAGTVARDSTFAAPFTVAGARTCFPFALAPGDEITLCFAAEAIAELRTPGLYETPNSLRGRHDLGGGLGGLGGLAESDFGGFGTRGSEAGLGRTSAPTASVRLAKPDVVGPLDKDIVRRIVRAHLNEVRFCYTQALARDPKRSGTVTIGFTIDHEGSVVEALPKSSTIADDELVTCMAARVVRWKFPKPSGAGTVKVSYPFVLTTK
ncbi:MAG TPA: AgmX/PglI C-terminal domain-containing protein [Nannocystaceae bacterium]|nr:AgmX/PglI C-terminal domain-containing protein [Nannocystaceae bacterium]